MKYKLVFIEYIPLILVEFYFFLTLYVFLLGPLKFPVDNTANLVLTLVAYNCFLAFGYILSNKIFVIDSGVDKDYFNNFFFIILILGSFATFILYKNITFTREMSIDGITNDIYRGLLNPEKAREVYAEKIHSGKYNSNIFYSFYLLFFAWSKFVILPYIVFFWDKLSFAKKTIGVSVGFLGIFTTLASSVSAIIFNMLFAIASIFILLFIKSFHDGERFFKKVKSRLILLILSLFLILMCVWHFYSVKNDANLITDLISESPVKVASGAAGQSYLSKFGVMSKKEIHEKDGDIEDKTFFDDYYEKITFYMVNGYVGMAYSLNEKFDSTYGVGHSKYLLHVFDNYLGFDFSKKTFQRKITEKWDENIFWHSFYSHWANDFGFFGVCGVMFFLGIVFSFVYRAALYRANVFAVCLIPLFFLMFIYMPANNQIFSFVETMTSFWFLLLALFYSTKFSFRKNGEKNEI